MKIVNVREGAEREFKLYRRGMEISAFSYSATCAKSYLTAIKNGPYLKKTSRYVLYRQEGNE
jgi:hypothetical protein